MQRSKLKFKDKKIFINIILVFIMGLLPFSVKSATLYLDSSKEDYAKGDTFIENVILDTESEVINSVEVEISYPSEILEVKEISTGNSILDLWVSAPEVKGNTIYFSGGAPNGYEGKDGKLVSIIFLVKKEGVSKESLKIKFLDSSRVLLNDGKGTEANLTLKPGSLSTSEESKLSEDEWNQLLESDKNPPEPFKIKLSKDPLVFNGEYFISFATTDKETGIDHYEVLEIPFNSKVQKTWKTADSPYVLEDQNLQSEILVKAIDKAGNERISRLNPRSNNNYFIIILILVGLFFSVFFFRRARKSKK